jgi:hypothetical protein
VDEEGPQLLNQEIDSHRDVSLDEVLAGLTRLPNSANAAIDTI